MKRPAFLFLIAVLVATALPATAASRVPSNVAPPLIAWQPPADSSGAGGRIALAEVGSGPVPFYPITPCRQYDSRSTAALADNTPRTVTLSGAPCGIPPATNAIAVNITVFSITGAGSNGVFKVGTSNPPTVAWVNYPAAETQRANAGVVAVDAGALVVQVNQGAGSVDFVVDVFGYYPDTGTNKIPTNNVFTVWGDRSGTGVIFGRNDQTAAATSHGVEGWAYSTGANSSGVSGKSWATAGVVHGVQGGISSTTSGASAVYGLASAATGATYGVQGVTSSTSNAAAGVMGTSDGVSFPDTPFTYAAGVLGRGNFWGVLGKNTSATGRGVQGNRVDATTGVPLNGGVLSYTGSSGVHSFTDITAAGTKSFVEPHPADPARQIVFVAMEGPEAGTYFRGRGRFVGNTAVIVVPESFRLVTEEEGLTVQITPIGRLTAFAVMSMDLNQIVVEARNDAEFSYLVQGVRKSYRNFEPIQPNATFVPSGPDARMDPWPARIQRRLIDTGVFNPDGTVNMSTSERLGWAQTWKEEAAAATASSKAAGK